MNSYPNFSERLAPEPMRPLRFALNVTLDGCYYNIGRIANADYGRFAWMYNPAEH